MTFNNLCCFPLIVKFLERNAKRELLAVVQRVGRAVINLTDAAVSHEFSIMDS